MCGVHVCAREWVFLGSLPWVLKRISLRPVGKTLTSKLVCTSKILSQSWNSGQRCVLLEIGSLGSILGGLIKERTRTWKVEAGEFKDQPGPKIGFQDGQDFTENPVSNEK